AFLFLRQEIASQNRMHAEHIKIVGRQTPAEDLHWIAQTGEREEKEILPRQCVEHRLSLAKMLVTRRRHADVDQITRFVAAEQMENPRRFFERQAAQEQIIDQTENAGV